MNILYVSYGDFYCNSTIHIFGFANQLAQLGHACAVAVPSNKESVKNLGAALFRSFTFDEVNAGSQLFEDGKAPALIHCWTPREVVRKFVEPLREKWRSKLAIHLEDNEERLLEEFTQTPIAELRALGPAELDKKIRGDLSHPLHYRKFLESADGETVIMARLKEFLPYSKPSEILWPGIDFERFKPLEIPEKEKAFLGLKPGEFALAYTGHVHWANREEVRALYLALGELNRRGVPTRLLRTGEDFYPFLSAREEWVRQYEIKLGKIEWKMIPRVLNAADVLVQPGRDGAFNAYRLPSKLPEFLAVGKAVLLPASNLGLLLANGENAIVLKTGCWQEIAACAEALFKGPELRAHLGEGARRFALKYFDRVASGLLLERFYKKLNGAADAGEANPILELAANPNAVLPEDQQACDQLMQLNYERWQALVGALNQSEERLAKMSAGGTAAKVDFETRLHAARRTRSWRLMRLLRRVHGMLWKGDGGGIGGFFRWVFKRGEATGSNFDPFEGAEIHGADFERTEGSEEW